MGPRNGLDVLGKKKNFLPLPAFEPRTIQPASSLAATPNTLTRYLLKGGY